MRMSNGFEVIAESCHGTPYGHVPGHGYTDVEVGVGKRGNVFRVAVIKTWGSAQGIGRDEEHGRVKVVTRNTRWRQSLPDAKRRAVEAGIGSDIPEERAWLVQACSDVEDQMDEFT